MLRVVSQDHCAHRPSARSHTDMIRIPGGTFRMGSDRHYPEEAPVHRVTDDGFWTDRSPVTNRQFRDFVRTTGYVTFAEREPDPKDYPNALPHMLRPGSLVFSPPNYPVNVNDWGQWWAYVFGASWRRPYGPGSTIKGLDDHPVVQHLLTYEKFPPLQASESYNLSGVLEQVRKANASHASD
ncbi:hypothetical protein MicloDRAFT_00066220 [Microvirga lotononidis]|uniref:Sulfatase-modifying factor enzyme-like domain-containing protein n=1 Tax=Microvirga lotononidis TaxID=864069 RepID=I4YPK1_9HYPH|nr:hypothetical protein MicloDRAFT_00066220 [Microvirga lotononidis]